MTALLRSLLFAPLSILITAPAALLVCIAYPMRLRFAIIAVWHHLFMALCGTVLGLPAGTSVTLANAGVLLPVAANGPFSFPGLITAGTTWALSAIPLAMVVATEVPMRAPAKFRQAAMTMAYLMGMTPVETTVAMALAVSWKPLM